MHCASEVIATKSGAQHKVFRGNFRMDNNTGNWKSITHALGHGIDVGVNAGKIV